MTEHTYPDPVTRRFLTASIMAASIMSALDTTIANVALPHIQGSVSASQDEITWVLTSYIVATALFIPLIGWLANRFGRKRVLLVSVLAFTIASALCGLATNLAELVAFRFAQGMSGAALMPMSQAVMLDANPPERQASAMSLWAMGVVIGPIAGPVLGGWLTDNMSWRWVFYVNVPIGMFTLFGISTFLHERPILSRAKLDIAGFCFIAFAVGALQLMLDRGQQQDWFSSTEVCIEAALALFFLYCFVVHMSTARAPLLPAALFTDRNFVFGMAYAFLFGMLLFSVLALLPTMLEQLLGFPVLLTGIVSAPRGIGSFLSMLAVGVIGRRVDTRLLMLTGFALIGTSLYLMSSFSLLMDSRMVILSGFANGVGSGMIFAPLTTMAFATLDTRYRNDATSTFTLIRNLGSAVGISLLQVMTNRSAAAVHSRLTEGIRPDNPLLALRQPGFDFDAPAAVARLNAEISRQAAMVGYIDGYWALFVTILVTAPLILLMKNPRVAKADEAAIVHVE